MLLPFVYHTIPPCKNRSINQSNDLERVFESQRASDYGRNSGCFRDTGSAFFTARFELTEY